MLGLKKFLFRGGAPTGLPEDVKASLDAWRTSAAPALEDLHFHTRYLVVDIVSSGLDPEKDQILGIAASSIWQGAIQPDDTFYVDFSTLDGEGAAVDRQLMAFPAFCSQGTAGDLPCPVRRWFPAASLQGATGTRLPASVGRHGLAHAIDV